MTYKKPTPRAFTSNDKRRANVISKRQERKATKLSGGIQPPGSGNKGIKGDVISTGYRRKRKIECKTTDKKSIRVERKWLEKLENQCNYDGSEPVLMFGFSNTQFGSYDWGAVPYYRLQELFDIEDKYYKLLENRLDK